MGFRHRYYDALGNRREKPKQGLVSENIAIRELLKVKTDLINGNVKRVDNTNITVSEWVDIWYEENERNWAVSTRDRRKAIIKDQIKPHLGKYKLSNLDRLTYITKYINVLLDSYSVSSVENYHNIFRIAVNAAVENEIIERNRFTRIPIASADDDEEVLENFLSPKQLKEFLAIAKEKLNITRYTGIFLSAYTGLRRGEAQGLKWKDIDFENKKLTEDRTRYKFGTRAPKTKNSRRTIVISDLLINQLILYRKRWLELKLSNGSAVSDDDYILITSTATLVDDKFFNYAIDSIVKGTELKRITPHGLRHTHATILLTSKDRTPVAVIARRLGNTPETINRVYGHVIEEAEQESVVSFDDAINH